MAAARQRAINLYPEERIDALHRNGLSIIQKKNGFCFGMDAVLLSGFAQVRRSERALDLGTGTGIIPILLSAKTEGEEFFGLEVQEEVAEMAAASVYLNGLSEKIRILRGNLQELAKGGNSVSYPKARLAQVRQKQEAQRTGKAQQEDSGLKPVGAGGNEAGQKEQTGAEERSGQNSQGAQDQKVVLRPASFDVVISNPPYMKSAHGLTNPDAHKAISRHEVLCSLSDVCAAAAWLLRSGGRFYLVHRPQRLPEIITALCSCKLEPKRMKFVHPFSDREANMVLIEAVKDAGSECRIEKPLIVYKEAGVYTDEIYDIYGY